MTTTLNTTQLKHPALRELDPSELDAVSGGMAGRPYLIDGRAVIQFIGAIAKAISKL